ncbi:Solute carrier family 22 member 13 [Strongyloides ratti]|uniref:Solute carrier family 22 member 13 n=1 Tax=Strongyloides ratti TaxID=34506 RepID=A0A090KR44_STRRB|nr:Solute carrier family 22 member 13 [Strongyloides ratti]CEF59994.1 Solute carrier family 22 member 13 [Strongyloides ratti]
MGNLDFVKNSITEMKSEKKPLLNSKTNLSFNNKLNTDKLKYDFVENLTPSSSVGGQLSGKIINIEGIPKTSSSPSPATVGTPSHFVPLEQQMCPALIYSEPALNENFHNYEPLVRLSAFSETALQHLYDQDINEDVPPFDNASLFDINRLRHNKKSLGRESVVQSNATLAYGESIQSVITTTTLQTGTNQHKQSFSTREIREQHMEIQKKYRPSKKRNFTDPVDFEGILNIIGGCSWWQMWVYLLISFQQIPHAMFNLNVVYMMYQPDHWCQVDGFEDNFNSSIVYKWNLTDAMNTAIVFNLTNTNQRDVNYYHDQCKYFDRGSQRYRELRQMDLKDAILEIEKEKNNPNIKPVNLTKCRKWMYADDVMTRTIVTEWNLVCEYNFHRAHAHLFYAFGCLVGCMLGGAASDRYGRKPTIVGFGILSSIFGLVLPYSTYFPMFLFFRFCGAICNEAADLAAYILCMEVTGTRYRAMVGSLLQAPWAVGYAMLALIAYYCKSWQHVQLITAALHTIAVCLICVLPESPRWLIVNNRVEEAERYIRRACQEPPFPFSMCIFNKSSLPCDLELVKHAEQRQWIQQNQRANLFHVFKSKALCVRSIVICIVWVATCLVYYGLVIAFSDQSSPGKILFSGNFFINNAIAGAVELPTLIGCVYLMKYGRKRAQMISLIGAAILIFIAMFAVHNESHNIAIVTMLGGKIFIQGAFNILYIFTSELYPTVIRNSAVGFNSMIARFGSGVSSYIAILSDVTLPIVPMMIFSCFSLFAGVLVLILPETLDRPLPDTLQDAVTFLKNDNKYHCYGFSIGTKKHSTSIILTGKDGEQDDDDKGKEDDIDDYLPIAHDTIKELPDVSMGKRRRRLVNSGNRRLSSDFMSHLSSRNTSSILGSNIKDINIQEQSNELLD